MRSLYSWLLSLHPKPFRDRFGQEMLLVFDDTAAKGSPLWLFGDLLRSLFRQWILRSRPSGGGHAALSSDTPLFASIETAWPRPSALVCGGVLSIAMMAGILGVSRAGGAAATGRYGFVGTPLSHSTWGWTITKSTPLDSPPGQRLKQWLDAYNTGEERAMRRFVVTYVENPVGDEHAVERKTHIWMSQFQHFGPFQLESVHQSRSDRIIAMARVKTGEWWWIQIRVSPKERHAIEEITTQLLVEPNAN